MGFLLLRASVRVCEGVPRGTALPEKTRFGRVRVRIVPPLASALSLWELPLNEWPAPLDPPRNERLPNF